MKKLWEIFVPIKIKGKKFSIKHHQMWDEKVCLIAEGLTLFKKKKGRWKSGDIIHKEKMIRVRIGATDEEMRSIAEVTCTHYQQEAVAYYLISPEFHIFQPKKW